MSGGPSGQKEPQWLSELADGGAPDCPNHPGTRTERSEVVSAFGSTVFISGIAHRGDRGCEYSAQLEVEQKGRKAFPLPRPGKSRFSIIDFSPDGQRVLLSMEDQFPDIDYRDVEVTAVNVTNGEMHWVNVRDLFGWRDCDATVEAQGFSSEGRVVLRPRPSVWSSHPRPDCVKSPTLFATDLKSSGPQRLPDDTEIERYGKEIHPAQEACRTDPDIIGACFQVHGRLSIWNGSPSLRIWRIGTKRILGVHRDMPPPESVIAHVSDFGDEVYADFTVCPFTEERPGAMQMVCIESAENVVTKKR